MLLDALKCRLSAWGAPETTAEDLAAEDCAEAAGTATEGMDEEEVCQGLGWVQGWDQIDDEEACQVQGDVINLRVDRASPAMRWYVYGWHM